MIAADATNANLSAPFGRLADWAVVAFGTGIAAYFAIPFEPSLIAVSVVIALTYALFRVLDRRARDVSVILLILWIALGVGRATWHTDAADAPILPERSLTYDVTGWVEGVERGSSGLRWIVRVQSIDADAAPHRIRVNIGEPDAANPFAIAGQGVAFTARLRAPPAPAIPGGYDSARAAYYKRIGAYGRLLGEAEPVTMDLSIVERAQTAHTRWRYHLAERVQQGSPSATAGLQVALITGIRTGITEEQLSAMRDAGLAHVVAISGLHMAVFSGFSYVVLSLVFASVPFGRRGDRRKIAATIALVFATTYLLLSGASVSTQRAYIMIAVWLIAVIIEREPFSLRSVTVAAFLTLAIHPESLLSAGFHMSFAAVAALIVAYGWWNTRRESFPTSRARRVVNWFAGLAATSAIAGTATAGFAILHFGRWARYGLAGNLLAMPLFTAVTMPMAMVAILCMPLGLEHIPLWFMGQSLSFILWVATWVSEWPGAVAEFPGASPWAVPTFASGLILLLLGRRLLRVAGIALIAFLPLSAYRDYTTPIRVSDRGVVTLFKDGQLYSSNPSADGFGRSLFAETLGVPDTALDLDAIARCDAQACLLTLDGRTLAIANAPAAIRRSCEDAEIVILTQRAATAVDRRACQATLIDADTLAETGGISLSLHPNIVVNRAHKKGRKTRPWR